MGLVVHTSAFTAHRSVILGKLWFVGNFNSNIGKREHSWVRGWGIRYPCDWRARSLGSKRPSGIYRRRDVLLDHIISTQTLGNVNIHGFGGWVRGTPVIDVRGV